MITFAHPVWIPVGISFTLMLGVLLYLLNRNKQKRLEQFGALHLIPQLTATVSSKKGYFKQGCVLIAILLLFIALAGPQYKFRWIDVKRKGIDILFALDTSKSMLAEDISPNRLERAKYGILDFIENLEGDRVGLLPFTRSSFLLCPLTIDYQAFTQALLGIDTSIIPHGGTDLSQTITHAEEVLSESSNYKILIILSDGENLQGDVIETARKARQNGMMIYTVGVGTRQGELIPDGNNKNHGYMKDDRGNFVTSRLDEDTLSKIAGDTGMYLPLGLNNEGLQTIYNQKLSLVPKEELLDRKKKEPIKRYQWLIVPALFLLILDLLLTNRKTLSTTPFGYDNNRRSLSSLFFMLFTLTFLIFPFAPSSYASQGEDFYNKGQFSKAQEYYNNLLKKESNQPEVLFNAGASAYRLKDYEKAISYFKDAFKHGAPELQQKTLYNLANSQFRKGEQLLSAQPEKTTQLWEEALSNYKGSLELDPDFPKAAANAKTVASLLEKLKKQQQQQNQNQKKNQQQGNTSPEQKNTQNDSTEKQQSKTPGSDNTAKPPAQERQSDQKTTEQNSNGSKTTSPEKQPAAQKKQSGNGNTLEEKEKPQKQKSTSDNKEKNGEGKAAGTQQNPSPVKSKETAENTSQAVKGVMTQKDAQLLLDGLLQEENGIHFIPRNLPVDQDDNGQNW